MMSLLPSLFTTDRQHTSLPPLPPIYPPVSNTSSGAVGERLSSLPPPSLAPPPMQMPAILPPLWLPQQGDFALSSESDDDSDKDSSQNHEAGNSNSPSQHQTQETSRDGDLSQRDFSPINPSSASASTSTASKKEGKAKKASFDFILQDGRPESRQRRPRLDVSKASSAEEIAALRRANRRSHNRMASLRSRLRSRERIAQLEAEAAALAETHRDLSRSVDALIAENSALRGQCELLSHWARVQHPSLSLGLNMNS